MSIDNDTGEIISCPLSIYKAFLEVQKKVSKVKKDAKGHNSTYATLGAVCDAVYPILNENNIHVEQSPTKCVSSAGVKVVTQFTNVENGDFVIRVTECPMEAKRLSDPQAFGSSITYARRYALLSILGLVTEDDDGQSARISFESEARTIYGSDNCEDLDNMIRGFKDSPLPKWQNNMLKVLIETKKGALKAMEEKNEEKK